jgi:hypothetical protein
VLAARETRGKSLEPAPAADEVLQVTR